MSSIFSRTEKSNRTPIMGLGEDFLKTPVISSFNEEKENVDPNLEKDLRAVNGKTHLIIDFKAVENRSLEELALENYDLKNKLIKNNALLNLKKHEMIAKKTYRSFETQKQLPRKIFAFLVQYPKEKRTCELDGEVQKFIDQYASANMVKVKNYVQYNNYIYFKVSRPLFIREDILEGPEGVILNQISPKEILKFK